MTKRLTSVILVFVLAIAVLAGCMTENVELEQKDREEKINIVCTVFPVYDWLNEIVGENSDKFSIRLLAQGGDVHSYQPTLSDILNIHISDLFVYVGGVSEQWTNKVLKENEVRALKLLDCIEDADKITATNSHDHDHEGHSDGEYDEHIWLSLRLAEKMVNALCDEVSGLDVENTTIYRKNADEYCKKLKKLDAEYKNATDFSADKTVVFADRFPFVYLARDYGIECYAAFPGCSSDTDASFETVAELSQEVRRLNKKTVLVLENSSQTVANAVIEAIGDFGIQTAVMNSCQAIGRVDADKEDYIDIMRENLDALKQALN